MKQFWDERYAAEDYVYGKEPNRFFQAKLLDLKPGKALFPAEGEGRNSVFAAENGWEVFAFDISDSARMKAERLAAERGVTIHYQVGTLDQMKFEPESFDLLVLIFAHFPGDIRHSLHQNLLRLLKPGGTLILEAFSKEHLEYNSINPKAGGPKDVKMLFSKEELDRDFGQMEWLFFEKTVTEMKEGDFHVGLSSVIRLVARK
ncbi:class I SAM-dependent methyltransferase [Algoriphagus kandeliae]|uniref:Class I SAM-dependent methyltransferase n=1 Tax=Algoriphagus kandeliae TaxID=2562278 RepID=A0A4Y9QPZ7_9BACT|nr:class I SAM-dependent methyltransferase [Algoriphagus kandeliae]TFV94270.1 class I SAM-dependent methyltransferase [Algoriphagus kandeliae]